MNNKIIGAAIGTVILVGGALYVMTAQNQWIEQIWNFVKTKMGM